MEKFSITFAKDDILERFLEDRFSAVSPVISVETDKENKILRVETKREDFKKILADAITIFHKFRVVKKALKKNTDKTVLNAAFFGVIIGKDFINECADIEKRLPDANDYNFEGIFLFLMDDYNNLWKILGSLCTKLLSSCSENEDILALIKYFLGGQTTIKRTLIIENTLYFDDNNEEMFTVEFFESKEENIMFNVLLRRPAEILIPFAHHFSEEMLSLIKKLGE